MAENEIFNENADAQESAPVAEQAAEVPTATTNAPVSADAADEQAAPADSIEPQASTEAAQPQAPVREPRVETPHDDFDWSIDKRNVSTYNKEERQKYDSVYDNTFVQIKKVYTYTVKLFKFYLPCFVFKTVVKCRECKGCQKGNAINTYPH